MSEFLTPTQNAILQNRRIDIIRNQIGITKGISLQEQLFKVSLQLSELSLNGGGFSDCQSKGINDRAKCEFNRQQQPILLARKEELENMIRIQQEQQKQVKLNEEIEEKQFMETKDNITVTPQQEKKINPLIILGGLGLALLL